MSRFNFDAHFKRSEESMLPMDEFIGIVGNDKDATDMLTEMGKIGITHDEEWIHGIRTKRGMKSPRKEISQVKRVERLSSAPTRITAEEYETIASNLNLAQDSLEMEKIASIELRNECCEKDALISKQRDEILKLKKYSKQKGSDMECEDCSLLQSEYDELMSERNEIVSAENKLYDSLKRVKSESQSTIKELNTEIRLLKKEIVTLKKPMRGRSQRSPSKR